MICCLLLAIDQSHSPSYQQHLAFVGILVTLVVVAVMSALLFSVGLMLVYSLTRDFTSRHATKLFLLALTFSCTLLGQSLVLVHQAVTVGDIYSEFNKDNMMYYGLDAVGHVLVLAMFARSVSAAATQRKKHTSQASTTDASLKVVSSIQSSQPSQSADKKARSKALDHLNHLNRPSFHQASTASSQRPKQLLSPSSNSQVSTASGSQVQLTTWDRSTTGVRVLPPLLTSPTFNSRTASYSGNVRQVWSPTVAAQAVPRLGTLADGDERLILSTTTASSAGGLASSSAFSSPASSSPSVTTEATPVRYQRVLPPLIVPASPSLVREAAWSPFRPLISKTRVAPLSPASNSDERAAGGPYVQYGSAGPMSPVSGHTSSWMGNEE